MFYAAQISQLKFYHFEACLDRACLIKLQNFNAVGPTLSKKAKAVSAQFEERHGAKTVRDFKLFVDRLPQMQVRSLSLSLSFFLSFYLVPILRKLNNS